MMSRAGSNRATWRHNCEPIEPPAPVTRTTLPVIAEAMSSIFVEIGLRPMRSSRLTSRKFR